MRMQPMLLALLVVTAFLSLATPARADTFAFSYHFLCGKCGPFIGNEAADLFVQANGVLTTTDTPVNGALLITGISGTRTTNWFMQTFLNPPETGSISGLVPPDTTWPDPNDNLLYPSRSPHLDDHGFSYNLSCGPFCGGGAQITYQPGGYSEVGWDAVNGPGTFTLSPVPEPKPAAFLILAALVALVCRRAHFSQKASVSS